MTDATIRRYLLGQLSESETEQIETRLLADDALSEAIEAAEDELLHDFVRGALPPAEHALVDARFDPQDERVAFARALAQRASTPVEKPASTNWRWLTLAASLVLVASIALLVSRARRQPSPEPPPAQTASQPSSESTTVASVPSLPATNTSPTSAPTPATRIASLALALTTTRNADNLPAVTLDAAVAELALQVRTHPADRAPRYEVTVTGRSGSLVSQQVVARGAGTALEIRVPAGDLAAGRYQLSVRALREGSSEDLGSATFLIRR